MKSLLFPYYLLSGDGLFLPPRACFEDKHIQGLWNAELVRWQRQSKDVKWIHILQWQDFPSGENSSFTPGHFGCIVAEGWVYSMGSQCLWSTLLLWGPNPFPCCDIIKMIDYSYWLITNKDDNTSWPLWEICFFYHKSLGTKLRGDWLGGPP